MTRAASRAGWFQPIPSTDPVTAANNELNDGNRDGPNEIRFGSTTNMGVAIAAGIAATQVDTTGKNRAQTNYARNRAFVIAWKLGHQCMDCNRTTNDPSRLELDHRDPTEKWMQGRAAGDKTRALNYQWSHKRVVQEVAKCDVVCKPCHEMRTSHQIERAKSNDPEDITKAWNVFNMSVDQVRYDGLLRDYHLRDRRE